MKGVPLFLSLISFLLLDAYGRTEVCISQGGRFPPFSNEGRPPRKASKGPRDLTFCRVFRKNTCCDVTQTHLALLTIRRLASSGEASEDCLQLWEHLECSICHPHVGVQRGPPRVCASFCDRVYDACSTAYFSLDARTQVLEPCGLGDFVCGKASEWVSNGTDLCRNAGFSVKSFDDLSGASCYDGKSSLDYVTATWKKKDSGISQGRKRTRVLHGFRRWVNKTRFNEKVSWAVGGMVLTAGILFARKRKNFKQHQKQVAIQRAGRKLGTRMNPGSPVSQGNRAGNGN